MTAPQTTFRQVHSAFDHIPPHERLDAFERLPLAAQEDAWDVLRQQLHGQRLMDGHVDFERPKPPKRVTRPVAVDCALDRISPPVYIEVLTGEVTERGWVRCPNPQHDDSNPSCRVWDEPARGFYCWSCGFGGSIFDLAAAVWDLQTRGADFVRVKERLEEVFA